ncbi:zinc finger protein 586-like isoform X1 [Periplaneta americana]|uniref:zinc finger protein 586-like isoform X1 n=1 Tax=Periplaneta americana TaxID=6978 RepID=UPI0037E7571D
MSLNFRYICRLCLKQNVTLISIFSEENGGSSPTLPVKIKSFAPNLKIFVGDGLPDHVCQQCASQIDSTYKFKLQCESSDATLRQSLLNQTIQSPPNDIFLTVLETGPSNESRNNATIKHEVKEEIIIEENHINSENNEEHRTNNDVDFIDSSNDTWSDIQVEPSSSKSNVRNKYPKKKQPNCPKRNIKNGKKQQQDSHHKANTKTRKKVVKGPSLNTQHITKTGIEQTYEIENDAVSLECVKEDDDDCLGKEFSVKVEMRVKKPYIKLFHCHDCGKDFAKKTQLVLHMSAHTGAKPFICSQCGRTFASRINLKKHLFTHTGEKPYLCTRCGISFGRIDTLTKHMRSHTGEKPFHCSVCGNNFARRSTFTNHMRTHSGEKPYLCTECGWRCVQSYDLKKHMRCHTGERPFRCTVCRLSFGQRSSLTKHMRCHIGEVPVNLDCAKDIQYRCQV